MSTTTATPTTAASANASATATFDAALDAPAIALHDWADETLTIRPTRFRVAMAWLLLVGVGLCVTVGGFAALRRLVTRWPRRRRAPGAASRAALLLQIRAALRRALTFYIRQAWCLQKSAVLVCLSRSYGVPAELVIGVQKMPFHAHAWVEVDGAVINGPATFKTRMLVIERW